MRNIPLILMIISLLLGSCNYSRNNPKVKTPQSQHLSKQVEEKKTKDTHEIKDDTPKRKECSQPATTPLTRNEDGWWRDPPSHWEIVPGYPNLEKVEAYEEERKWIVLSDSLKQLVKADSLNVIYMREFPSPSHSESFEDDHFQVDCFSMVDTNQVLATRNDNYNGKRSLLIGYNHIYSFQITNKSTNESFQFELSKREDLEFLRRGYWVISNLNPWKYIAYNKKYQRFIFEFDVNPWYNYGEQFYMVFDKTGRLVHRGYHRGWGGGGADGDIFVGEDHIVTCREIYDFQSSTSRQLHDIAGLNDFGVYAKRTLDKAASLVIFVGHEITYNENCRIKSMKHTSKEANNAVIIKNNGEILWSFRYDDFLGEMDHFFLVNETYKKDSLICFDSKRMKLIFIERNPPYKVSILEEDELNLVEEKKLTEFYEMKQILKKEGGFHDGFEVRESNDGKYYYTFARSYP